MKEIWKKPLSEKIFQWILPPYDARVPFPLLLNLLPLRIAMS